MLENTTEQINGATNTTLNALKTLSTFQSVHSSHVQGKIRESLTGTRPEYTFKLVRISESIHHRHQAQLGSPHFIHHRTVAIHTYVRTYVRVRKYVRTNLH